ncbi:hypothetical protein Tco_0918735 [Tanacetum coccineum]
MLRCHCGAQAAVNEAQDSVMSSSSTVTYTSVYTDSEPRRVFWGADEELFDGGSLRVIVYGYDGLPRQPVPYVPEPEYLEYLVPSDKEAPMEDQPLPADALPIALSLGYVADFNPEEDPEEDHADYPANGGDDDDEPSDDNDDDDDDDDTDDEDEEASDDEEEEHLAPADSSVVHVVDPVPSTGDTEAFESDESAPTPRSPQTIIPSPPLPPLPSSLHLPPPVPTSLPLPSLPLPPLPASLFIPPPVDHREDIPEAELPPHKRLCLTAPTSRYEVGESSTAAPRPTRGHRVDYGFISTLDAKTKRQRVEEVDYGIRDVWEQDTKDIYAVIEDAQDRQTQLSQRVDGQLSTALEQIQALQARDQTHTDDPEGTASTAVGFVLSFLYQTIITICHQREPTAGAAAAAPMTAAAVEQLIEERVSAALVNHETLRNSTKSWRRKPQFWHWN